MAGAVGAQAAGHNVTGRRLWLLRACLDENEEAEPDDHHEHDPDQLHRLANLPKDHCVTPAPTRRARPLAGLGRGRFETHPDNGPIVARGQRPPTSAPYFCSSK